MQPVIEVSGLGKSFGRQRVLAGLDFTVAPGEVFALLGPNGAGKTTTINILTTLTRPMRAERSSPASTSAPTPNGSSSGSASPASPPRSTTCSPARRTS